MKIGIAIIILGVMIIGISSINKRLDKLIEISTPEYINLLPTEVIKE